MIVIKNCQAMADGCKSFLVPKGSSGSNCFSRGKRYRRIFIHAHRHYLNTCLLMSSGFCEWPWYLVNDARAMRIAELMNDYRTLQLHISQQLASVVMGNPQEMGYSILSQSAAAAQCLLASGFSTTPIEDQGSDPEMERAHLRQ